MMRAQARGEGKGTTAHGIEVIDLCVSYDSRQAVRGVSFQVASGEVYGILGPSGAGKSSILGALTGVIPSTGRLLIAGTDCSRSAPRQRRLGNVYQDFRLFDWMTVYDNAAFGCRALGWGSERIQSRVPVVLAALGLQILDSVPTGRLSGGERQRVAIARALAYEPSGLLLDEPFSDLDPPLRRRLRRDLLHWVRQNPIPTILVTHDRREAFEMCDRVGFLSQGCLEQEGEPRELHRTPATLTVAEFMGYDNGLRGTVRKCDGHLSQVDTPAGVMTCRHSGSPLKAGDPVEVRFAARSARFMGTGAAGTNLVAGTCETIRQVEEHRVATVSLESGAIWSVECDASQALRPGQSVTIAVAPEDLLVFLSTSASPNRSQAATRSNRQ